MLWLTQFEIESIIRLLSSKIILNKIKLLIEKYVFLK